MSYFSFKHSSLALLASITVFISIPTYSAAAPAPSADTGILRQIESNTRIANTFLRPMQGTIGQILTKVDAILKEVVLINNPEPDKTSSDQQSMFSQYSSEYLRLLNLQNSETNKNQLLDVVFNTQSNESLNTSTENDLSYFILKNSVYIPSDIRNNKENAEKYKSAIKINEKALNYILNASAARISHQRIMADWNGEMENQMRYRNTYATLMSVQSYGAYVLSRLLLEQQSNNELQKKQDELLRQATDGEEWFSKILSERLPTVIRQILMYESQNYVLLTQSLEIQRQQLAAQVMTNSLLILNNQTTEDTLLRKAKNKNAL